MNVLVDLGGLLVLVGSGGFGVEVVVFVGVIVGTAVWVDIGLDVVVGEEMGLGVGVSTVSVRVTSSGVLVLVGVCGETAAGVGLADVGVAVVRG